MGRQLHLLRRVVDVLSVVASTEPTRGGQLHVPIFDLTLPARGLVRVNQEGEQVGEQPIATWLMMWWKFYAGRPLSTPDPWMIGGALADELPAILETGPDVGEFAAQLRRVYGSARRALGRDLRPTRYMGRACPSCGVQDALTRFPGDWIECSACNRLWDDPDMRAVDWGEWLWARQLVEPWTVLDVAQAAMYAGVTPEVIWQWTRRGRLTPIRPALRNRPRFWALEVDRCTALAEHRERERERRRSLLLQLQGTTVEEMMAA